MTHILEHASVRSTVAENDNRNASQHYVLQGAFSQASGGDECLETKALAELGIGLPYIEAAAARARLNGTSAIEELLASGLIREDAYYGALARALKLPFMDSIPDGRVHDCATLDVQLRHPTQLRVTHSRLPPLTVIAPEATRVKHLSAMLDRLPGLRQHLAVSPPSAIKAAAWRAGASRRVRDTVVGLFESQPRFSARVVFHGHQGFYAGLALSLLVAGLLVREATELILHILLTLIYSAALLLRGGAVFTRREKRCLMPIADGDTLPVYTVLIAVYREAEIARQLVSSLKRLDWPVSKLDIKFVCEADDHETIAALKAQGLGRQFEIVEVPPMHPRTKPKALTYALNGARGEYLVVYDAEDRPHPQQLREAYARFGALPDDVACLQAPLVIGNGGDGWLCAMFALEYSALFRGLLPMLAKHRLPLPLGGTSNHFRTDILRQVGAWDPYNVTEDADLGMRLYRLGYRCDVIERQTIEDAPNHIGVWSRQRTRWFKGWLQTWLVTMRHPAELRREIGTRAFCVFQLLIGGMLLSSLIHPLVFVCIVRSLFLLLRKPSETLPLCQCVLLAADIGNMFCSYAIFLLLGRVAMIEQERKRIGKRWMMVPVYWMMVSLAAWRAVIELRTNPFFWHKTPHKPSPEAG